jgi:hypothetical protein
MDTNNTASGIHALRANTISSFNTALGNGAGSLLTSGNNNIYLGSPGVASESSTPRLGNGQTRAFIKGGAGVPLNGRAVVITPTGQLGVQPTTASQEFRIAELEQIVEHQAQQL